MRPWLPFPAGPVLFLTAIFYVNFTGRVILAPLLPVVEAELGIGHGAAGSLFLWLQVGYAAGLLASGVVSALLCYRRTIALSALGLGGMLLLLSQSGSLESLRLGLVGVGAAAGLYLPAGIAAVTELTEERHWGKALAVHEMAPNLGFITAPFVAEFVLRLASWRGVLGVFGVVGLGLGAAFALRGQGGERRGEPIGAGTLGRLLLRPTTWMLGLLFAVGVGGSMGLYTVMTLFLVSDLGFGRPLANSLTGGSRLLSLAVLYLAGTLSDRTGPRRAITIGLVTCGILTILLGLAQHPVLTPLLVLGQSGAAVIFFPAAFALISALYPPHLRGLGVSLAGTLGSLLGAGAIPAAVGHLAEVTSFGLAFSLVGGLILAAPLLLRLHTWHAPGTGGTESRQPAR